MHCLKVFLCIGIVVMLMASANAAPAPDDLNANAPTEKISTEILTIDKVLMDSKLMDASEGIRVSEQTLCKQNPALCEELLGEY